MSKYEQELLYKNRTEICRLKPEQDVISPVPSVA